jgi:hypothetical protein
MHWRSLVTVATTDSRKPVGQGCTIEQVVAPATVENETPCTQSRHWVLLVAVAPLVVRCPAMQVDTARHAVVFAASW